MSSPEQEYQAPTKPSVEVQTDEELLAGRLDLQLTQAAWSDKIVEANTGWLNNLQEILTYDAELATRGIAKVLIEKDIPADLVGPEAFAPVVLTLVEG